jgi:NADH-quinone oxidoreductase subunit B
MIGDQGVIKPEKISLKDEKAEARKKMTTFRSPDEV